MSRKMNFAFSMALIAALLFAFGCAAPSMPKPGDLVAPEPLPDNSGNYMAPYSQDGVVAPWCDKAINVSVGSTVGQVAGAYAGSQALRQVPFVGGVLGAQVGKAAGRAIAINSVGGMEYIRETSDQSFHTVEELCVWMYATKSSNEHYQEVFKATGQIYPEFKERYYGAVQNAARH